MWASRLPYLGRAQRALEREVPRKGGVNKGCLEAILAGSPRPAGLHFSGKKCKKMKINVATWNVRTMLDKDYDKRPERRTTLIAKELHRYNIDIAALQETRLEGQGQAQEKEYTSFWSGRVGGRREAGVAFAISNKFASKLTSLPTGLSERIILLRTPIGNDHDCYLSVISFYAPTMMYPDEEKEAFYEKLAEVVDRVPMEDKLLILGDFYAIVGNAHTTYDGTLGKFGKGKKNSNGELMLQFCTQRGLSIANTFFQQPDMNFFTWRHPRSKHLHLIDYVVTRKSCMPEILSTKAIRGAECSTYHYMVWSQLRLQLIFPRRKDPSNTPGG